ncbi:hypothetical protein COCMIDRAFT_33351 [Bipolaris oryzae ATCC 44560]|uniref:Uncharacterized protein n=1 Tax=Bipolaris oryzae ATCC 44560 TaxID=930090 RepID=W6ZHB3_COCMI|nr:uncharacterized protein COCMIDRAFT_33351 [Bipolaris oryzae ATCC 44560]EUC49298.1 hypothetical protein COCMIDRAFT_33351 [Bipolaris oryzae ATCC 44560]
MSHHPKSWQLACAMFGALSPYYPPSSCSSVRALRATEAPRRPLLEPGTHTRTRDIGSSYEAVAVVVSSASPFTCGRCRGLAAWPQRKVPSKKNSRKKRNLWTGMLARWNWMICTQHQIMEKRPTSRDVAVGRPGEGHQLRRGMPMPMGGRMGDVNHGEIDTRRGGLSATTHSHKHGLARSTYLVPGARC